VEEAGAIFGIVPNRDPDARMVRLTPNPTNPIAEWSLSEVEATRSLRNLRITRANPKVGPGGVFVFAADDADGNRDIYSLDPVSEELRRLTDSPSVDDWPTLAPDGKQVFFTSYRSGNGDLYSVDLAGEEEIRLTDDPLRDASASVRGDSVLFVRGRGVEEEDGNMEIMLLVVSTGQETALTNNRWNDYEQAWSPDGRFLCWQSERLGHYESDIMVMELATGRQWNATDVPGRDSDCRWTPTGNGLLHLRFGEDDATELIFRSLTGEGEENISRYRGSEEVVGNFSLPEWMR
jgi:Tol biopolymer transport system component